MDDTGFIQKQHYFKVVVSEVSRNVWSKCADVNFHTNFFVCVYDAKYVAPPLLILPGKLLNRDVIKGCDIEGDYITTPSKGLINSTFKMD